MRLENFKSLYINTPAYVWVFVNYKVPSNVTQPLKMVLCD
jgi:hypothetical protein